jgi:hypothetical protein
MALWSIARGDGVMRIKFFDKQDESIIATMGYHEKGLRLRDRQGQGLSAPVPTEKQALKIEQEKAIVCRNCRHPITSTETLRSIDGSRTHTFFNPAGIIFELICFSHAPGCAVYGAASTDFSWFSGFTWRVALCGNCHIHLGWFFESGDASFFGLIIKKLIGEI